MHVGGAHVLERLPVVTGASDEDHFVEGSILDPDVAGDMAEIVPVHTVLKGHLGVLHPQFEVVLFEERVLELVDTCALLQIVGGSSCLRARLDDLTCDRSLIVSAGRLLSNAGLVTGLIRRRWGCLNSIPSEYL